MMKDIYDLFPSDPCSVWGGMVVKIRSLCVHGFQLRILDRGDSSYTIWPSAILFVFAFSSEKMMSAKTSEPLGDKGNPEVSEQLHKLGRMSSNGCTFFFLP